jgi:hypothetical protein
MKELLDEVNLAMVNELERAMNKKPFFVDGRHAYGVIKEEKEEAESEFSDINSSFHDFWFAVKNDNGMMQKNCLMSVRDEALHGAAELIQVAAMAQKGMDSME